MLTQPLAAMDRVIEVLAHELERKAKKQVVALGLGRKSQMASARPNFCSYFETPEELPSATEIYRILMCMGERGLL